MEASTKSGLKVQTSPKAAEMQAVLPSASVPDARYDECRLQLRILTAVPQFAAVSIFINATRKKNNGGKRRDFFYVYRD